MRATEDGLATPDDIAALADHLSRCADELHARIQDEAAAISTLPAGKGVRRRATVASMLDAEQVLRQRANGLYADAAAAIVAKLGKPQQDVIRLTVDAAEKIRQITLLSDATGLVAGLLALAGGVASAQPGPVLAALETIRTQLAAVKADLPPHVP